MWIKFSRDGKCYRARIINVIEKEGGLFNRFFCKEYNRHYLEIEELDFDNDRYYPLTKECVQYTLFLRTIEEADDVLFIVELQKKAERAIKDYEEEVRLKQKIQMNRANRVTVIK